MASDGWMEDGGWELDRGDGVGCVPCRRTVQAIDAMPLLAYGQVAAKVIKRADHVGQPKHR